MKKAIISLITFIFLIFTLSGCRFIKSDISKMNIILALGIDGKADNYNISVRVFEASSPEDAKDAKTSVYEASGKTVSQAVNQLTSAIGNPPLLSQSSVIIIGEKTAQNGIKEIFEYFISDDYIGPSAAIVVSTVKAADIITSDELENFLPTDRFTNMIRAAWENGTGVNTKFAEAVVKCENRFSDFCLPVIEFDSSKLTLKRVDTSSQIENGTFRYHIAGDTMTGIYVCNGTSAPKLTGECMTLVFRVNGDAVFGETSVSAQIDQVVDWSAKQLPSVSSVTTMFRITPEFTKEAVLTKLVPNQGTLEPAFDPYIQEYSLQVGVEVEQILFELEAADGGTARVNRKNLGKQGSVTQFIITVTSSDKKNKSQYIVNVTRGEKIKEENESSKSTTSGRSKTNGSGKQTTAEEDNNETLNTDTIFYGDRNLYIVGNQMPSYFVYMIAGGIGIFVIVIGIIVLLMHKKKK